jgi:hypothetical protein
LGAGDLELTSTEGDLRVQQQDIPALTVDERTWVLALTGAGVSAESGVPTFRGSDGLWENHRFEDVASPGGFERDPELVWRFYSQRRAGALKCFPNPGHEADDLRLYDFIWRGPSGKILPSLLAIPGGRASNF